MAKGVEDTAFYVYNRLLSLERSGRRPRPLSATRPRPCTATCRNARPNGPMRLSPLSTHDTKRSEDVRARLNVLSELPDEWREAV